LTRPEENYRQKYQAGDTPWDTGRPDFNLVQTVTAMPVDPCQALDIGCGTGNNSIWLAQNNFTVTGIDTADTAIQKAGEKAALEQVKCTFLLNDIFTDQIAGAPFGFVFDRGCFHSFNSDQERKLFAEKVAGHLAPAGLWLSIIGNADEKREFGPPQRTATEIITAVESSFEIISLTTSRFESNHPNPPRAWVCLMRKRNRAD